jgi:hypothetical protein
MRRFGNVNAFTLDTSERALWYESGGCWRGARLARSARGAEGARRMTNEVKTVRRILHFKLRTPAADTAQLLPFIKAAIPFYEAFGRTRIRLLHNVDDPTQFVQVVEYETDEAFEMNRQRIAGDPTMRAFLQTWRTLLSQAVEIDVYEDVTDAME